NKTMTAKAYTFSLTAKGSHSVKSTPVTVSVAASSPPPTISSLTASPQVLPAAGGPVTLKASVTKATTCTFASSPAISGLPVTVSCSSGSASTSVTLPRNPTTSQQSYAFSVTAIGSGSATTSPVMVAVDASPPPSIVHVSGSVTATTTWSPFL